MKAGPVGYMQYSLLMGQRIPPAVTRMLLTYCSTPDATGLSANFSPRGKTRRRSHVVYVCTMSCMLCTPSTLIRHRLFCFLDFLNQPLKLSLVRWSVTVRAGYVRWPFHIRR